MATAPAGAREARIGAPRSARQTYPWAPRPYRRETATSSRRSPGTAWRCRSPSFAPQLSPAPSNRARQPVQVADGEPHAFVEVARCWIEFDRGVPEVAHHLHLAAVVPDVNGDPAAFTGDARHLGDHSRRLGNEVEHEARDGRRRRTLSATGSAVASPMTKLALGSATCSWANATKPAD